MDAAKELSGGGTKSSCLDWHELAYIRSSSGFQRVQLKDIQVGDLIMTANDDLTTRFVPVMIVALHPRSEGVPLLELTAVAKNGQLIRHRLVGKHMLPIYRHGRPELLPASQVQVGDQMVYVAAPESAVELLSVHNIERGTAEGLAHIWTTAGSHCANGVVTSTRVEGDYGLVAQMMSLILYHLHPQLPGAVYRILKSVLDF